MTESQIRQIVLEELGRIAPEQDLAEVDPDQDLRDALDLDSFDALRFIIALNERVGVEIPEADYGKLTTLRHVVRYVDDLVT